MKYHLQIFSTSAGIAEDLETNSIKNGHLLKENCYS